MNLKGLLPMSSLTTVENTSEKWMYGFGLGLSPIPYFIATGASAILKCSSAAFIRI
jgi:hypothetical protein